MEKEKATIFDYARMCKESKSICYSCKKAYWLAEVIENE